MGVTGDGVATDWSMMGAAAEGWGIDLAAGGKVANRAGRGWLEGEVTPLPTVWK
jgi:hypothetical protein